MKKTALVILDGWGLGAQDDSNGIFKAKTPNYDELMKSMPNSKLTTHGLDVGLPEGQMGNSEVGHMNIGAGRVVFQDLQRINNLISKDAFLENKAFLDMISYAKDNAKPIHMMGLVSDGGVHAHKEHLLGFIRLAKQIAPEVTIFIHAFTDGRDCDPKSGMEHIKDVVNFIEGYENVSIASISGRYYAMDRDNRWERIKLAYDAMVKGIGVKAEDAEQAILDSYQYEVTDEFIIPVVLEKNGSPVGLINDEDVVFCFNFRTDRCREITIALTQQEIDQENLSPLDLNYFTLTEYDKNFKNVNPLLHKENISNTLGEVISNQGLTQLRIAETEKYPHVTFFFNGGREEKFKNEDRFMANSPSVATYDLQPEMSALEITERFILAMQEEKPDFICINYANGDMVGHTGVPAAIIKACETVDECLGRALRSAKEEHYQLVIIADHGNADLMYNADKSPNTAHTTNLVPCIFYNTKFGTPKNGRLADVATTILDLMNAEKPKEMTGDTLLV